MYAETQATRMPNDHTRTSSIDARFAPETLAAIKSAAEIRGRSVGDFAAAVEEAAARTIQQSRSDRQWSLSMAHLINKERVNDTAKLMMHRLISRELGRDPSLVDRARDALGRSLEDDRTPSFIRDWIELLKLPVPEIRHRLTSRDEDMTRLRLSSPFVVADGVDFEKEVLRRRIWRAAKRIANRSMVSS